MKTDDTKNKMDILTAKQISEYLQIPLRTIYHLTKTGKLKAVKIGKHWRYFKSDIEQYYNLGTDLSKEASRRFNNSIECRSYPRINTNFKCQYSINLPPFKEINNKGIIKDISAGGIFLINQDNEKNEIKINDPILMKFVLILDDDQNIDINAKGKVVRKTKDGLGIKFKNINKEAQNRIMEYAS